jgi:hypothetical protein
LFTALHVQTLRTRDDHDVIRHKQHGCHSWRIFAAESCRTFISNESLPCILDLRERKIYKVRGGIGTEQMSVDRQEWKSKKVRGGSGIRREGDSWLSFVKSIYTDPSILCMSWPSSIIHYSE